MLRIVENAVYCLDLTFHHITEHLVVREVLCDEGCRCVCTVSCSECVVDVAVSIRSKLLDECLLALFHGSLGSLLLFICCILCETSWFSFLFCIETEVLKYKYLTWFESSYLLVSSLAVLCKFDRGSEEFLNTAEDMTERKFLCYSLRASEVRHDDERSAFFKDFLESRDCCPDTGVICDFHLLVQWNVEVNSDNCLFAGKVVSVNVLLHSAYILM